MRRLLLWDVDGTIVSFHGASRPVFEQVLSEVAGVAVGDHLAAFDGRTDPLIADETLAAAGVPDDLRPMMVRKAMRMLGPELANRRQQLRAVGTVLPGVREVLTALVDLAVVNTVLTGNLAVNAVLKLDLMGLTDYFDLEVGAYGSDTIEREDLVEVAIDRVEKRRNYVFEDDEMWIIGDTPRDLIVARENRVRCLLVATGTYDFDHLQSLDADAVMQDLRDTDAVLSILTD